MSSVWASSSVDPFYLFVAGQPSSVNNYRIPAVARKHKGTVVAIAEARSSNSDCLKKWLVYRCSTDNGTTWAMLCSRCS